MADESFKDAQERFRETRDDDVSPKGETFKEMKVRVHAGNEFSTRDLVLLLREDFHDRFTQIEAQLDRRMRNLDDQIMYLTETQKQVIQDHEARIRGAETKIERLGLNALIARIAIPIIGALASAAVVWNAVFPS
jgi:hypothetical protein